LRSRGQSRPNEKKEGFPQTWVGDPLEKETFERKASQKDSERDVARKSFVDTTNLIRSIQRSEGNEDCFLRKTNCDQYECAWRAYCLGTPQKPD
jgi:hypothetical protein